MFVFVFDYLFVVLFGMLFFVICLCEVGCSVCMVFGVLVGSMLCCS